MKLKPANQPRQQIFQLQAKALSSLERAAAERAMRVFDQAWANRLWSVIPMLPTRPPRAWRHDKSHPARLALQNTYQTAAFAFDVGIPRLDLAGRFANFRQFMLGAREAVRLFDIRIGPPWWVRDRAFLEMVYTAVMAQEEPATDEMRESMESYLGDDMGEITQWMAESWLDHCHAQQAGIIDQCRMHYFEQPSWLEREQRYEFGIRERLKPGKDPLEARLSMLLNWQVMWQPNFSIDGLDDQVSFRARTAFPHRAEERRLIRLLNLKPRGRPQRGTVAAHA